MRYFDEFTCNENWWIVIENIERRETASTSFVISFASWRANEWIQSDEFQINCNYLISIGHAVEIKSFGWCFVHRASSKSRDHCRKKAISTKPHQQCALYERWTAAMESNISAHRCCTSRNESSVEYISWHRSRHIRVKITFSFALFVSIPFRGLRITSFFVFFFSFG